MRNALSFLLLMLVSTVPAPAEDNFSFPQDQKVRTVGNAVFEKLENGNILFSAKPGKGWPQIIFQDVPVDPEADRLFIRIKQCSPEKKDIPVLAESVTAGAMPPRYIHSLLKPGKFVDLALKPPVLLVEGQASPLGAQVGMIVSTKENVIFTIAAGYSPEETTHVRGPPKSHSMSQRVKGVIAPPALLGKGEDQAKNSLFRVMGSTYSPSL